MTRATKALRRHPNSLLIASMLLMGVYLGMVLTGGSARSAARLAAEATSGKPIDYLCRYPGCNNRVSKQGEFCKLHKEVR